MLFVAALAIASAACAREEVLDGGQARGEFRTFTCSFDEEAQTKTDITKQGKTVWSEGDKIFVTNGTESDTLTVDSKFAGQRYFEFSTTLEGEIYVVYPCAAAKEVKEGKFTLEVPSEQNGLFGSANIACAVAKDRYVKMRNVTSVIRFKVDADAAAPVKAVAINTPSNNVAGVFSVDMTSGSPVVSTIEGNTYTSDVTVRVDGNNGNAFYATVIPGTYGAGLTMTAVTTDLHHASESKTTVSDKEFKVNAYYDLGTIGADLKPLAGEGTQGNPWQISTLADFLAFAYYVNDDHNMEGEYVKLMDNIKTVTTPVGYYDAAINVKKQFIGDFDGNGKTVTVNINQTAKKSCGLFGAIAEGANIHDVTVEGTVNSTFDDAAGVCGLVNAGGGAKISNCVNNATVDSQSQYAGGIVGYADATGGRNFVVDNCKNSGKISGTRSIAGICGRVSYSVINNSSNTGEISASQNNGNIAANSNDVHGVGGVAGFANNTIIDNCSNSGKVTCINKAGGIVGYLYWASVYNCQNSGNIHSTKYGVNAGIAGAIYTSGNVTNCVNTGAITGDDATGWTGGIVGSAQAPQYKNQKDARVIKISNCANKGEVNVTGAAGKTEGVGGVIGYAYHGYYNTSNPKILSRVEIVACANEADIIAGGTSTKVGGIVGRSYDSSQWTAAPIWYCSNTGNVTGDMFVGGIIGSFQGRNFNSRQDVENCENKGNILGKEKVGGIFGGALDDKVKRSSCGVRISNCLNLGNISYKDATNDAPCVGGISGYHSGGTIRNSYNGGKVGPKEGSATEAATGYIGSITGLAKYSDDFSWVYTLDGIWNTGVGTASPNKVGDALLASADGTLATAVTINSIECKNVVEALNAWVNGNTYWYSWTTGPKFSLTGKVSIGDGLDLGNGGKL